MFFKDVKNKYGSRFVLTGKQKKVKFVYRVSMFPKMFCKLINVYDTVRKSLELQSSTIGSEKQYTKRIPKVIKKS